MQFVNSKQYVGEHIKCNMFHGYGVETKDEGGSKIVWKGEVR